jgi:hypothetical protein
VQKHKIVYMDHRVETVDAKTYHFQSDWVVFSDDEGAVVMRANAKAVRSISVIDGSEPPGAFSVPIGGFA